MSRTILTNCQRKARKSDEKMVTKNMKRIVGQVKKPKCLSFGFLKKSAGGRFFLFSDFFINSFIANFLCNKWRGTGFVPIFEITSNKIIQTALKK